MFRSIAAATVLAVGFATPPGAALACESDAMLRTQAGFITKVAGLTDRVVATTMPGGSEPALELELLRQYFVICDAGTYYRITDKRALSIEQALGGITGYVAKDDVFVWSSREALAFAPLLSGHETPGVWIWDDRAVLKAFFETGNSAARPPGRREMRTDVLRRDKLLQSFPVVDSRVELLRGSGEFRVFDIMLPADLPADAVLVIEDGAAVEDGRLEQALGNVTFAITYDSLGSVGDFARAMASDIESAIDSLPVEVGELLRFGFVFYFDRYNDVRLSEVAPLRTAAAMEVLEGKSREMAAGGFDIGPVLDATYHAGLLFDWSSGERTRPPGTKVIVAVHSVAAILATEGYISADVPEGLSAAEVGNLLAGEGIRVIAVEGGPAADESLAVVLSTLAAATNGEYIAGGDQTRQLVVQIARTVSEAAAAADVIKNGMFVMDGHHAIPLALLDGTKLAAIREAGIDYRISAGVNGRLLHHRYLLESPDVFQPQILIDKATLQALIDLLSIIAHTGVDAEDMLICAGHLIAAIVGEHYDPGISLAALVRMFYGLNFRTELLDLDIELFAELGPVEMLSLRNRIQDKAEHLAKFLEANLTKFDTSHSVWMPIALLP